MALVFGMVFALNLPYYKRWLIVVEEKIAEAWVGWLAKIIVASVLSLAFTIWATTIFTLPHLDYNLVHPFFSTVPIHTYIFLRNLSPTMRGYHSAMLHEMGKITLESYLMQHHIWLTSNAKTLLNIVDKWPIANLVVATVLYIFVSWRLHSLTLDLRALVVGKTTLGALVRIGALFGYILLCTVSFWCSM